MESQLLTKNEPATAKSIKTISSIAIEEDNLMQAYKQLHVKKKQYVFSKYKLIFPFTGLIMLTSIMLILHLV